MLLRCDSVGSIVRRNDSLPRWSGRRRILDFDARRSRWEEERRRRRRREVLRRRRCGRRGRHRTVRVDRVERGRRRAVRVERRGRVSRDERGLRLKMRRKLMLVRVVRDRCRFHLLLVGRERGSRRHGVFTRHRIGESGRICRVEDARTLLFPEFERRRSCWRLLHVGNWNCCLRLRNRLDFGFDRFRDRFFGCRSRRGRFFDSESELSCCDSRRR